MEPRELAEQADILAYISEYVELEQKGNEFWGLSPFTNEKTPSFSVDPQKGVWKDFSSGKGGDVISFIQEYDKCSFGEAVSKLREHLGIPKEKMTVPVQIVRVLKKNRKKLKVRAAPERKILPEAVLKEYQHKAIQPWIDEGISQQTCAEFGILYDPHREAIVIPIYDTGGNLINLCMRTTNPHHKELGIPKYIYKYPMGTIDFFYGWNLNGEAILEKGEVIVVEGAKSVMKLRQFGYRNAVAALTSHLNERQMEILLKAGVDVVIAFDADASPATDENIRRLKRFCKVFVANDRWGYLGKKDAPCDKGNAVWEKIYEQRIRLR